MCQNVRFEVGGLSKLFIASVKRANVGSVPSVNADVRPEVKVQREAFPAALKSALNTREAGHAVISHDQTNISTERG